MAAIDSNTGSFGSGEWQTPWGTDAWVAQTFQASQSYDIASIKLQLRDYDSEPQGIITVGIRAVDEGTGKPTGADLVSGTYDGDDLTVSWAAIEFTFSSPQALVSGTSYAIVIRRDVNGPLYYGITSGNNYANGGRVLSHDAGVNWFTPSATVDLWFETYAVAAEKATDPTPAHEGTDIDFSDKQFSWTNGAETDTWELYLGDAADNLTLIANGTVAYYFIDDDDRALFTATGYWRVDSINEGGTTTGDVWNFTCAAPGKAQTPTPTDTEENIRIVGRNPLKLLEWEAPS